MAEDMSNAIMGGDWLIILILFILLGGGFGGGYGNGFGGRGYGAGCGNGFGTGIIDGLGLRTNIATTDDVYNSNAMQNLTAKLADIQHGISASAYENAALINGQGNNIVSTLNCGFNNVTTQITALSTQIQQCCCDLKTQLLQDKYDAVRAELLQAQGVIANTAQSHYIIDSLRATTTT